MERRLFSLIYVIFFAVCFLYVHECFSQNVPVTWKRQLDFLKNNAQSENRGDANDLEIVNYSYKGSIGSEENKSVIIDSMLSLDAPFVRNLLPVIERDTFYKGDSCVIQERDFPRFEIISIRQMIEIAESRGKENPLCRLRKQLNDLISPGFEYLELEWKYKEKRFKSIGIVSDKQGGFIYEPIGSNLLFPGSAKINIREGLNSR